MKKIFSFVMVLLFISLLSCNKEKDDDVLTQYYFEYDGNKYQLSKGFLINYGYYSIYKSYEFDIYMFSGMTAYDPDSIIGSGPIIGFNIYCSSVDITSGTYPFSSEYGIPGTFDAYFKTIKSIKS